MLKQVENLWCLKILNKREFLINNPYDQRDFLSMETFLIFLENIGFFKEKISNLLEVSIGHALITESLYNGFENIISKYKYIIYISCNPKSYIRDIKLLSSHEIKKIELFDQFPNTEHLEIISLLQRK